MRPIDGDAILKKWGRFGLDNGVVLAAHSGIVDRIVFDIETAPTLNVTLVIPCKCCKYFKYGDYCAHDKMEHSHCDPDDYCSYVELREESDTENEWED